VISNRAMVLPTILEQQSSCSYSKLHQPKKKKVLRRRKMTAFFGARKV